MGSRISIALADLLSDSRITVELTTVMINDGDASDASNYDNLAIVHFGDPSVTSTFSYSHYQNTVELEADFNFFRNPEQHTSTMRLLFEHSVPFRVIPG
jgi:hypothetical protein